MPLLRKLREKFGLKQQEMSTLLGLSRAHYAMVENERRLLPAEPAVRFASLLPLMQQAKARQHLPVKANASLLQDLEMRYLKATYELNEAARALDACNTRLTQLSNLECLLQDIEQAANLPLNGRGKKLLTTLKAHIRHMDPDALAAKKLFVETRLHLCRQAATRYASLMQQWGAKAP